MLKMPYTTWMEHVYMAGSWKYSMQRVTERVSVCSKVWNCALHHYNITAPHQMKKKEVGGSYRGARLVCTWRAKKHYWTCLL